MSEAARPPRCAAVALAVLLTSTAAASVAAAAPGRVIHYLYVEASDGGSSGGHVALRLGEHVPKPELDLQAAVRLHAHRAVDQRLGIDDAPVGEPGLHLQRRRILEEGPLVQRLESSGPREGAA